MENKPKPYTQEQTKLYAFCKRFCEIGTPEVMARFGWHGKLNCAPFQYCTYYQICGYEIEDGRVGNPANRQELERYFNELQPRRAEMEEVMGNAAE